MPFSLPRRLLLVPGCLALLFAPALAFAAEVQFEGYYRARMRAYDTLSLNRELATNEDLSLYVQHRLWLKPKFIVNDKVALYTEFRGLDGVVWGDRAAAETDVVTGDQVPVEFTDSLEAPSSSTEARSPLLDFTLSRAWAEIDTRYGQFAFGRMPLHWGAGIWQNDGLSWNGDYGDSADRIRWNNQFDVVFVELAVDANVEGLINAEDDTTSFNASAAYKSETLTFGVNGQLRRTPNRKLNLGTVDAAFDAEIGPLDLTAEVTGQFGNGVLEEGGASNSILAVGAVLDAGLTTRVINVGLEAGLATGDGDDTDDRIRTFSFDRDYNVGLILFEQPMPTLAAAVANENNGGRSTEVALSGSSLSNALFIRPRISRTIIEGLDVEASVLAARVAKMPERFQARRSYGVEFNAKVQYRPFEHVELAGTFGVMVPGSYYSEYSDDTYSGFNDTVFAGQIMGQVSF